MLGGRGVEPLEQLVGQRPRCTTLGEHRQHGLPKQLEAPGFDRGLVQRGVDEGETILGGSRLEGLEHQLAPHRRLGYVLELALQLLGLLPGQRVLSVADWFELGE